MFTSIFSFCVEDSPSISLISHFHLPFLIIQYSQNSKRNPLDNEKARQDREPKEWHLFACIQAFHGLVRYEEDMQFVYPPKTTSFENVLESPELGAVGRHFLIENKIYDFGRVPDGNTNTMVKYYADQKVKKCSCAYRYPGQGGENVSSSMTAKMMEI